MKILVKTFFAMLLICVVSTQVVSAQEKGPCTDTDLPGETESTEEDSGDKKEDDGQADVQRDDNGDYWWNDNGTIKRVWPVDHPDAPWNRPSNSTSTGEEVDQANPNDSPGPYTEDDMLMELMLIMMDYRVDEDAALEILISDVLGGSVGDGLLRPLL